MNDFLSKLLNNRLILLILAALIVFGIMSVTGMNLSFQIGSSGIHAGIDR